LEYNGWINKKYSFSPKKYCIIQKLKIRKNIEIVYLSSPNPEFIVIVTFGVDMLKSTLE